MHVSELQTLHISKLWKWQKNMTLENANRFRKVRPRIRHCSSNDEAGESFTCSGTRSKSCPTASAFRSADTPSSPRGSYDIYVSPRKSKPSFNLHTGDTIEGSVRVPKGQRNAISPLVRLDSINGRSSRSPQTRNPLRKPHPAFPTKQFKLERDIKAEENPYRPCY